MNSKRLLGPILVGLILHNPPASAQQASTLPASPRAAGAILAYTGSPTANWRLYNGPLYLGYDHHAQGSPFFGSDAAPGSATYDGVFYPSLSLSYDLEKDIVIMPDKQQSAYIQLLPEKLTAFSLGPDHFTYLSPDSTAENQPATGYYHLLYDGRTRALAKHWKLVQNIGKPEENLTAWRQYDNWYLERNHRFILIHNRKSLLKAFGASDKGLRNFLKSRNISFKKDPAGALTAAAELLSQSNN